MHIICIYFSGGDNSKNQESPVGKEIDLRQWDTLIFKGEHSENEHWSLVEDRNGQVGYAPAGFLVVILDTTAGPGCRDPSYLRRDEVPSSGLASLDTSERNYWVARVPRIIHTSHVRLSL